VLYYLYNKVKEHNIKYPNAQIKEHTKIIIPKKNNSNHSFNFKIFYNY